MKRFLWIVIAASVVSASLETGFADERKAGSYRQVRVENGLFVGEAVAMLGQEKQRLADQIAAHVVNELAPKTGKGERASTRLAERLICLALHLDPWNRAATVANVQLGRGLVAERVEADYSPEVLSQLLVTRAKLLRGVDGAANTMLAGFLFEVAAEIFPRNEDAIYELEMFRLDEAPVDWAVLKAGGDGK